MGMTKETKDIFKLIFISFALGSILALVLHFTEGEVKVDPDYVNNYKKTQSSLWYEYQDTTSEEIMHTYLEPTDPDAFLDFPSKKEPKSR